MKVIVTTCGTSTLTNGAGGELSAFLRNAANKRESELSSEEKARIDNRLEEKREALASLHKAELRNFSAELNGLLGIREEEKPRDSDMQFLIHTDTYQGEIVARLLSDWCSGQGITSQAVLVESLNTKSVMEFNDGIGNLVKWCQDTLPGYRNSGYKVLFNLVGGFKSLQGYMQTLGMQFADESVYVFEGERVLLRIPRLPLDLDSSCRMAIAANLHLFRRLHIFRIPIDESECEGLPDTFFTCLDGSCTLSPWGEMLWEKFIETGYNQILLDSPSAKLRFTPRLRNDVSSLDPHMIGRINRKMDDLARFLETADNLKSLSFKNLQGNRVPGCTHEFYLWSDKDAARGFGFYDNEIFVFDQMRGHL